MSLKAIKVDHEEDGPGVVEPGLLDRCREAVLKETVVGKTREVVVKGIPLVGRDLLLEQDEQHADSDEKLLQVPDLIGEGIVSRMDADPGVEEEDERPDDEADDNSNLAEAFAGQADLKYEGRREIQDEENEVGRVAKGAGGGEVPDGDPRAQLDKENPPASVQAPGAGNGEGAGDAEEETTSGDGVINTDVAETKPVDGEQGNGRQ